ncbi:MAG: hypothetical protein AAF944_06855 [Bacteroidota bacterium]
MNTQAVQLGEVQETLLKFFQENESRTLLPYSALDESWVARVKEATPPPPYIFISEASTIYFSETENHFFTDPPEYLKKHIPLGYRILGKILSLFNFPFVQQYQLNVFQLGSPLGKKNTPKF